MKGVGIVLLACALAGSLVACGGSGSTSADVEAAADGSAGDAVDVAADAPDDAAVSGRADLTWPVEQPGPYHVGYRQVPLTYVPAPDGVTRTIQVNVWYPTNDTTGEPSIYFDGLPIPHEDVFHNAQLAPPVDPSGYPLHVHSHGHLGFGGDSPYLVKHFASHGWVVVAPDHTGNTTVNNAEPRPPQIYWWRPADDIACLNWLEHLDASDPLAGKVRTDHTFLSGHSFGSLDVWLMTGAPYDTAAIAAACKAGKQDVDCSAQATALFQKGFVDKRVVGAAQLAGGIEDPYISPDAPKSMTLPMMILTGTADPGHPWQPMWQPLPHGWWVDIQGMCHVGFSLGDCAAPMTAEVGTPIVWTYTLALARYSVLGDRGAAVTAVLDGTKQVSPYATLQKK